MWSQNESQIWCRRTFQFLDLPPKKCKFTPHYAILANSGLMSTHRWQGSRRRREQTMNQSLQGLLHFEPLQLEDRVGAPHVALNIASSSLIKKKYYVVRWGYGTWIYISWDECKNQVNVSGAVFKSFTAFDKTLYPTSVEDNANVGCNLLDQAIGDDPNL